MRVSVCLVPDLAPVSVSPPLAAAAAEEEVVVAAAVHLVAPPASVSSPPRKWAADRGRAAAGTAPGLSPCRRGPVSRVGAVCVAAAAAGPTCADAACGRASAF